MPTRASESFNRWTKAIADERAREERARYTAQDSPARNHPFGWMYLRMAIHRMMMAECLLDRKAPTALAGYNWPGLFSRTDSAAELLDCMGVLILPSTQLIKAICVL